MTLLQWQQQSGLCQTDGQLDVVWMAINLGSQFGNQRAQDWIHALMVKPLYRNLVLSKCGPWTAQTDYLMASLID